MDGRIGDRASRFLPWVHRCCRTLADVKEFANSYAGVDGRESLERLSEMHPPGFEKRMQTTWGGTWYPQKRKRQ